MRGINKVILLVLLSLGVPVLALAQECRVLRHETFSAQKKRILLVTNPQGSSPDRKFVMFQAKLRVNTDGAPNSYHPFDLTGREKAINHICNAISVKSSPRGIRQKCSKAVEVFARYRDNNWTIPSDYKITWGNVLASRRAGNREQPCVFESGEFKGYFGSLTKLQNGLPPTEQGECSVKNQLDERFIPALVMAGGKNPVLNFGANIGDLLVAYNPSIKLLSTAIIGDSGPGDNLGEGSVALNMALLGRTDQPHNYSEVKKLDTGNQEILVTILPASRSYAPQTPYSKENIKMRATKFLQEAGFDSLEKFVAFGQKCVGLSRSSSTVPPLEPSQAEYAVRWEIKHGGPKSAEDLLKALNKPVDKPTQYQVEYFDVTPPSSAPVGFTVILRQRTKASGKKQLMFKYRGDHATANWSCPLPLPNEPKEEVDISFVDQASTKRAYSYSCTIKDAKEPPTELNARSKGCVATMTRLEVKGLNNELKVEEWRLPGDVVVIEVSQEGRNAKDAQESFKKEVVDVIVKLGARPSALSMTDLAAQCARSG